jgi:PAS domain S-box-containing protein
VKIMCAENSALAARTEADRVLRDSEERFRLLMGGVKDYAIIVLDPNGLVASWNEGAQQIKGYLPEEIIGHHFSEFYTPEDVQSGKPAFELGMAKSKGQFENEGLRVRKDGTTFFANVVITALVNEQNELRGFAKVTRDITESKNTERVLREGEQLLQHKLTELKRSNEDLEQFAYVCSHDLQEPLRVISNYVQLIAKRYTGKVLDENGAEFIQFTVDAAKRMQELINDLLLYSRIDSRGQQFQDTEISMVVAAAIANLQVAVDESGANITVGTLPTVEADRSQLIQLFQNLIGNAIKFRSGKSSEIQISAAEEPDSWIFTVQDNGQGFEMKYAERIFVIFKRLHDREQYEGSGIGLAVTKKIVERHGGRIWAESIPGEGSSFHFSLPKSADTRGITK